MNFNENRKKLAIHYQCFYSDQDGSMIYVPNEVLIGVTIQKGENLYFKSITGNYYNCLNNIENNIYNDFVTYITPIKYLVEKYKNINNLDLTKLLKLYLNEIKNCSILINYKTKFIIPQSEEDLKKINPNFLLANDKNYLKMLQNLDDEIDLFEKVEDTKEIQENKETQEIQTVMDLETKTITDEKNYEDDKDLNYLNGILDIINNISKNILHQDRQIKEVVTQVYKSLVTYIDDDDNYIKSNIIINGNTGCGKTEIARQLAKELNVPLVIEDTNSFTPSGYRGKDVTDMLTNLYYAADGDLTLAEKGILVIDEIDKKIGMNNDHESNFKNDVLNNLLKLIEGGKYQINISDNPMVQQTIEFDTSKLIVLMLGTFNNVKENQPKSLGFGKDNSKEIILNDEKFGLNDEFYGRISNIVTLNDLTEDDLYDILLNSKLSPIKKYQNLANKLNIDINFSEETLRDLAHQAYELKSGARGLYKTVTNYFNSFYKKIKVNYILTFVYVNTRILNK